jgi:post-segregation antitoxin (ccd killing protein)
MFDIEHYTKPTNRHILTSSTPTNRAMKRHNFHIPEQLVAQLKALANSRGLTMSELLRTALAEYLKAQK